MPKRKTPGLAERFERDFIWLYNHFAKINKDEKERIAAITDDLDRRVAEILGPEWFTTL